MTIARKRKITKALIERILSTGRFYDWYVNDFKDYLNNPSSIDELAEGLMKKFPSFFEQIEKK